MEAVANRFITSAKEVTFNSALFLWYHVSGGVIVPCDHLKHVILILYFMLLFHCTANVF